MTESLAPLTDPALSILIGLMLFIAVQAARERWPRTTVLSGLAIPGPSWARPALRGLVAVGLGLLHSPRAMRFATVGASVVVGAVVAELAPGGLDPAVGSLLTVLASQLGHGATLPARPAEPPAANLDDVLARLDALADPTRE